MELFDGEPVWHASVAKQSGTGPTRVEDLQPDDILKMHDLMRPLMDGVGMGKTHVSTMAGYALHLRRRLRPEEIQELPHGYMETACEC